MTTFPFDRGDAVPFYRQIYEGYRAAILSGQLRPGERLPSTRALASELGISRLPVVNAFEQLLHEGYVAGRAGAGTYVSGSIPDELAEVRPRRSGGEIDSSSLRKVAKMPAPGPFRTGVPALDRFPVKLWSRMVARHARQMGVEEMAYGDPAGHAPLRLAIADYLRTARSVRCDSEQVLIVSGSQMALQICAMALFGRGTKIAIEEPGYPGARDALTCGGAQLVPVRVDREGIDVDALAMKGRTVGAVYVTPSHQYPLGISMTASRRLALLEWARRSRAWIIEDDYDSEYRFASRPLGALQGMDNASRVIYIGTFSKVLFPSLRVGYLVVPHELIADFRRQRESIDLFPPMLEQLVLTEFLVDGHFGRHLRRMRAIYQARRDALITGLQHHAPMLTPHNSDAGLHVAAFLPEGVDDRALAAGPLRALDVGPLSRCYSGRRPRPGLIIGYGGASERRIAVACRALGDALRELSI